MSDLPSVIRIQSLGHTYAARRKSPARQALIDVSLELRAGEILGLLGPNGAGKSTLLSILLGALKPNGGGTVSVLDCDPTREAGRMRRHLGVMFQSPALDTKLTCSENLRLHGMLYGLGGPDLTTRVVAGLAKVGLAERSEDLVDQLSGGQKRRLELAKALLPSPALLILDEPSTGLDPGAVRGLMDLLLQLRHESGLTVLLATHHMSEAERCDRLAVLHAGRLAACGTPAEIRAKAGGATIYIELAADVSPTDVKTEMPTDWSIETRADRLCFHHADPSAAMAEAARRLAGRYRRISLNEPGLDDAFLAITGASLQ